MNNRPDDIYGIDKDALFDRINSTIDAHTSEDDDFSAFEIGFEDTEASPAEKRPRISVSRFLSAAAAVLVFAVGVPLMLMLGKQNGIANESAPASPAADEAYKSAEAEETAAFMEEAAEEEYTNSTALHFPASDGWDYTNVSVSDADVNYVEENYNVMIKRLKSKGDLFSEDNVLDSTDFFLDCTIADAEISTDGDTVYYTVNPIHVVSDTDITLEENTVIISETPYFLEVGREYLLPVKKENDTFVIADRSSPQIRITPDRLVVFHNGWSELCEDGTHVEFTQALPDDFFYDRMNITAESSLEKLFDAYFRRK
ncbi:MAG: hypothetical protein K6C13_12890 [Oscillospiraceae bacterium]|nr:hypothetical protein [Oscillospiraceae bacterium]